MRQLAEAVGILSGSVFHHFDSKEDILMAVMKTTIITMTERLKQANEAASNPNDRLYRLIYCELDLLHGDVRDGVAVTFFQWESLGLDNQEKLLKMRAEYESVWLDTLHQARRKGLIHTDPFITRRLLTGAIGWTIYWYRPDGPLGLDDLADQVLVLLTGNTQDY